MKECEIIEVSIAVEWLHEIDMCPDELYYNSVLSDEYKTSLPGIEVEET
jgi:hypothetical protein